jgi:hypothetical protein
MADQKSVRRTVLQSICVLPIAALLAQTGNAVAQTAGTSPVRVETKGLTA